MNGSRAVLLFLAPWIHSRNADVTRLLRQPDEDIEGQYLQMYPRAFTEKDGAGVV